MARRRRRRAITGRSGCCSLHGGSVGRDVPELGGDLGDYLFRLPFLDLVSGWLRQLLVVAFFLTLFASVVAGELRWPWSHPDRRRSRPSALAHLGGARRPPRRRAGTRRRLRTTADAGGQAFWSICRCRLHRAQRRGQGDLAAGPARHCLRVRAACWLVGGGEWHAAVAVVSVTAIAHLAGVRGDPRRRRPTRRRPGRGRPPAALHRPQPRLPRGSVPPRFSRRDRAARSSDGIDALDPGSAEAAARAPLWDITQLAPALQVLQGRTATRIGDVDLDRYEARPRGASGNGRGALSELERPARTRLGAGAPRVHPWRWSRRRARRRAPTPTAAQTSTALADDLVARPSRAVLRRRVGRLVRDRRDRPVRAGR